MNVCVCVCVPGKNLVVSVIFDAVLQRDIDGIPAAFAEPRVTQVTRTWTHTHIMKAVPPDKLAQRNLLYLRYKGRPGKNPGENLCRDTVITLDVKLKASSTPVGRGEGNKNKIMDQWRKIS